MTHQNEEYAFDGRRMLLVSYMRGFSFSKWLMFRLRHSPDEKEI